MSNSKRAWRRRIDRVTAYQRGSAGAPPTNEETATGSTTAKARPSGGRSEPIGKRPWRWRRRSTRNWPKVRLPMPQADLP